MPLSATTMRSGPTRPLRVRVVPRDTSKVRRFRLLMPTSGVVSFSARVSSSPSWTSTRTAICRLNAYPSRSCSCSSVNADTMSRTASAPKARASAICQRSTMKSLRNTGRVQLARTTCRYSFDPWKYSLSVTTDRHACCAVCSVRGCNGYGIEILPNDAFGRAGLL